MTSPESLERAREWLLEQGIDVPLSSAHVPHAYVTGAIKVSSLAALLDTVRAEERAEMKRVMAQEVGDLVREGARGLMARADEAERAVLALWEYSAHPVTCRAIVGDDDVSCDCGWELEQETIAPLVARIRERAEVPK